MIDMRPVVNESSTVAAVGYDAERQILGVRFHSSARVYTYAGVPADVAEGLRTAQMAEELATLVRASVGELPVLVGTLNA